MILKSIVLDNIRSYAYQEVRFPKGSILLSGDIGAGKSTILHAIEFALFGVQRGELSGSSLLRHGKNDGFVQLAFELAGKEIVIKRTLKRSKTGIQQDAGHLIINGNMVEATPIELKTHILAMLGYPKDIIKAKSYIYRYTVYTPQEQMKQILFDDREYRLDTLRKVFGIDRYKRMSENASLISRSLRERARGLAGQFDGIEEKKKLLEQYQQDHERLAAEAKLLEMKLAETRHACDQRKLELQQDERELKALMELRQQHRMAEAMLAERKRLQTRQQEEFTQLVKQLDELQIRLAALQLHDISLTKDQLDATIQEREKRIALAIQQQAQLKEKLASIDQRMSLLEQELRIKQQQLEQRAAKQTELDQRLVSVSKKDELQRHLQQHEAELKQLLLHAQEHDLHIKQARNTIEKVTRLDQCPVCLQPVSEDHKYAITAEENRKMEEHETLLRGSRQQQEELETRHAALRRQLDDARENDVRLATLRAELASLTHIGTEVMEKQELRSRLLILQQETRQQQDALMAFDIRTQQALLGQEKLLLKKLVEKEHLQQLLRERGEKREQSITLLAELEQAIARLHQETRSLTLEMDAKAHLEQQHARLQEELARVLDEERQDTIRHATVRKELDGVAHFMQSLTEELLQKEAAKQQAAKLSRLEQWLEDQFINLMTVMERHVMLRVYQEFNELFQRWFGMLMEDETMLVRLDAEFTPVVEQNGYEMDLDALSGGEKTAVALAYRLALNKVVNDIISTIQTKDIIILDEPTDGFSQQQLDRLKDVIDQLGILQVLMVSHESKVESFVDHVIRVEKAHHISRALA